MSTSQPIIKFSPFEALLIGEKNSILKRQPMKNTIFVSRLNRQCKTINLRVLFDLDKNETETNNVIFKIPQRVQDFLKSRKEVTKENRGCISKKEILCYEFEGQKINEAAKSKRKKAKYRSKFKRKRKKKDKLKNKAVRKFPKPTRNNNIKCKAVLKKKSRTKSKSISPKEKYLASYVLYLKEDRRLSNGVKGIEKSREKPVETVPNVKFDTTEDDVSKKSLPDFQIPKSPKLSVLNFDDDSNLLDIVFENFPKIVKFECESRTNDFSEALIEAGLVKLEDNLRYKKNGLMKNELMKILSSPFPLVRCQRINGIKPNQCIVIGRCVPEINEAYLKKSHVMRGKSLGDFSSTVKTRRVCLEEIR